MLVRRSDLNPDIVKAEEKSAENGKIGYGRHRLEHLEMCYLKAQNLIIIDYDVQATRK